MRNKVEIIAEEMKSMSNDLKYNTTLQLLYTGLLLDRYINMAARKYGENRSRFDMLHILIANGGSRKQSALSKIMHTKQAVNQTINSLERDGLVKREVINYDRRTNNIVITSKGLDLVRSHLPRTLKTCQDVTTMLTDDEMQRLNVAIKKIRQFLIAYITDTKNS